MTDAKPVEVGEIVKQLDALTGYFSGVGMDGEEIHSPIAKSRTALLALQAEVAALREWKKQILIAAGAQENDDVAKWICNSDAEVARLTQENALLAGEVANWRKKYGNDKPWDSPPVRTPIPTAIITKARRDEQ